MILNSFVFLAERVKASIGFYPNVSQKIKL